MNIKKFVKGGKRKMNRLIYKILKKRKEKQYLKYLENHKDNVVDAFYDLVMCPDMDWFDWEPIHVDLYERVLKHDDSKYLVEEFDAYRKQYYPVNEEEKILNAEAFEKAWEHHWKNNTHHWQARQNDFCRENELTKTQLLDCLENIIDWMAMGYVYHDRPYQFYEKNKDKIILPKAQRDFMEKVIYEGIDKRYVTKGE